MKFLADENFPLPSVKLLRKENYEIQYVLEFMRGFSDKLIMDYASVNDLIILTFDRDYGELIFKYAHKNPPAVVYFRAFDDYPTQPGEKFLELMNQHLVIEKLFTVIDSTGIRQRNLYP